jgi:hypothetical protein
MRRREFVAIAAAWPLLVRRAFADVCPPKNAKTPDEAAREKREREASEARKKAVARAVAAGKTVLIFVIPDDDGEKWERGRAFGEWLNHGDNDQLAPLARATVLCATTSELPVKVDGQPLMVLLRPGAPPRPLDGELMKYTDRRIHVVKAPNEPPEPEPPDDDTVFARRVGLLADLTSSTLGPAGPDSIALARQVRTRIIAVDPPEGSHWANDSGCATRIEATRAEKEAEKRAEEEALKKGFMFSKHFVAVGCGMGHVPDKSRRFLYFYARDPDRDVT